MFRLLSFVPCRKAASLSGLTVNRNDGWPALTEISFSGRAWVFHSQSGVGLAIQWALRALDLRKLGY